MGRKSWVLGVVLLLIASFAIMPSNTTANSGGHIEDDALRKAINIQLVMPESHDQTTAELEGLENVQGYKKGISSLKGLDKAINLKRVNLNSNNISDISPLVSLSDLEDIRLELNRVTDISPLTSLTNDASIVSWTHLSYVITIIPKEDVSYETLKN